MTKKKCFDGKPKMTKKFGFEISKSPKNKNKKKLFWPIFTHLQLLIEFSIFVRNAYTLDFLHFASIFRNILN